MILLDYLSIVIILCFCPMNYFDISKTVQAEDSDDSLLKTHEGVSLKMCNKINC